MRESCPPRSWGSTASRGFRKPAMVDYVFERHLSGGILLPANKTASTSRPIHRGFIPSRLVLAVRQHRGPGAVPCVQIGDRVLKGQTIASAATVGPSAAVQAP